MKIELPMCDLKECKYYSDGNCLNREKYERCSYTELREKNTPLPCINRIVGFFCPNCGSRIWRQSFCDNCGQALLWKE